MPHIPDGQWYAVGQLFEPFELANGDKGFQIINVSDLGKGLRSEEGEESTLIFQPLLHKPAPVTADELLFILAGVFATHKAPTNGLVISHSVYFSTVEMFGDKEMRARALTLIAHRVDFPGAAKGEIDRVVSYYRRLGLHVTLDVEEPFRRA